MPVSPRRSARRSAPGADVPIQGELFSVEQLEAHARTLAAALVLSPDPRRARPLLPRLDRSAARLDEAYRAISEAARLERQILPSEEWIRDNFHVIQDQIREIRQDLPGRYYLELPKLAAGVLEGYPRVYVLAREFVSHTEGRFDAESLARMVDAYQETARLSIGETWAIPIMLRLVLVETVERLADQVLAARNERELARRQTAAVARAMERGAFAPAETLAARGRSDPLSAAFVVELLQWLRDQPPAVTPVWHWLHERLEAQGDAAEEMIRRAHQREAADQLSIANAIGSMRLLSVLDWPAFFERVNLVEQELRDDPAGAYVQMDFPTRDRYRQSVEQLARRSGKEELDVAKLAIDKARRARYEHPTADRQHHVGYYLISRGRFLLEHDLGYRPNPGERLARFAFQHPAIGYLGSIGLTLALVIASLLVYAHRHGGGPLDLLLVAIVALIPVSEFAISLVHRIITSQIPPRPLPKLAMRDGIPASDRTMVVVPTILGSEAWVRTLVEQLEVRFLSNRDSNLHFALLTDFSDAERESMPEDQGLLDIAVRGVRELNDRYGADRFFLFHRARRWNPAERIWMGWERKRGKLAEFNRLLRGAADTSFIRQIGQTALLSSVRYVITLDSDTQLPMDAGRRLVGTLAHPLNRPRFDARAGCVTEGYGILQPRIAVNAVSANRTPFARIFSGHIGLDPYTTAVSDVYQDLFHEGVYVGKGIYEVDAFDAALAGRVPQNSLLSHDLFEGLYARTGLCTDIYLVDDYPSHYLVFAARQHRWVRGDWQILRWLWRTVPDASGRAVPNTLPVIARWKILDNLRRSLLAAAMVVLLAAGWLGLPGSSVFWTALVAVVLAFPAYVRVEQSLASRARGVPLREHLRAERKDLATTARETVLTATFLAHQAFVSLHAIGTSLARMTITRRGLLQWESAADAAARLRADRATVVRRMWAVPAIAGAILTLVAIKAPMNLWPAAPVLALWFLSPMLAYRTGLPRERRAAPLTRAERAALRRIARRTWRFFEEVVGPDDHWLVPDNYQEDRDERLAHRTSPTNVGLQLLSNLAAFDFGYIGVSTLTAGLERTFGTLDELPRYRGHFYNWYDTRTLAPLVPAYISTVDSGNLAGSLLVLRATLGEIVQESPMIGESFLEGLRDTVVLLEQAVDQLTAGQGRAHRPSRTLRREINALRQRFAGSPATLGAWSAALDDLSSRLSSIGLVVDEIDDQTHAAPELDPVVSEVRFWLERAAAAVAERQRDLKTLAPWLTLSDQTGHDAQSWSPPEPADVPSIAGLLAWSAAALASLDLLDIPHREAPGAQARRQAIERGRDAAARLAERAERLAMFADDLVEETDFDFLFDRQRRLFSIGYSLSEGRLDGSYYDMLASEARLASFVAIATGKIPADHWFKLGRSLAPAGETRALLSWSASMFEYLMPLLLMRAYPDTLLEETYQAVVQWQIDYGAERRVPWGISESAYNVQDLERNYQYRGFGVPGLGLKRGLAEDLVVAPYASALAAPIRPRETLHNLQRLAGEGGAGRLGYYDAIDYTPERLPGEASHAVLPTFMAHHQGMILAALDNCLNDNVMQRRFHADPRIQAADLLLQERIPHLVPLNNPPLEQVANLPSARTITAPTGRRYVTAHTLSPRGHLLSNGSYTVMITNAGGGYSLCRGLALTRWRPDRTCDAWGTFCYVRDLGSGRVWSTAFHPTGREPEDYEVTFLPDRAIFRRRDDGIQIYTEVAVSPEDDAELRRVSLTNHTSEIRDLELTSYAEVVLAPPAADEAHPAFGNLFVETHGVPERDAIIAVRRPRAGDARLYLVHVLAGRGRIGGATEYETDRARFLGRGGTPRMPRALVGRGPLSNTTGAVLDPIVSLRQRIRLPPGVTARLAFTTGFADSEEGARALIEKFHDRRAVARALTLAGTHSLIELRHLNLTQEDSYLYHRLAARLLYDDPRLRDAEAASGNSEPQPALWKYGISGDFPIVLVKIRDMSELLLVRELLKAHEYLRFKGFQFDLVLLNEHPTSYRQDLQEQLQRLIEAGPTETWVDRPGGVFLRRADLLAPNDSRMLHAVARAVLPGSRGLLRAQLAVPMALPEPPAPLSPAREASSQARTTEADSKAKGEALAAPDGLRFFNGHGGFSPDGREYVIYLTGNRSTPAPWINVVANRRFGFTVSESGGGCTWSENSRNNRLTPWTNDPVSDPPGEALFLRDEESGEFWSAAPQPARDDHPYVVRHGQGYSIFEHVGRGIASELLSFVPREDPVRIWRLRVRNRSGRTRRCSATFFVEWVLGDRRWKSSPHLVTAIDAESGALVARNPFRSEFGDRLAFIHVNRERTFTADRGEFIGRNGSLREPAAMAREGLGERAGALIDPCGALQVRLDLEPGEEREIVFQLGEAPDDQSMRSLVSQYQDPAAVDRALDELRLWWDRLLGSVEVRTPDPAMDVMLNRWMLYQTLSCRIWGRSALYQSSGAFGFRDQLQDVLGLLIAAPEIAREHILRAASRQFAEGDVQHWWHEPGGQGVRTRSADDRLWLPFAALQYASATGDRRIFDEPVPFLVGRPLEPEEDEAYERTTGAAEPASLYEHCARAVGRGLEVGAHGLPLMGGGDWNDGMNLVGRDGRGESVWLGWFLYAVLLPLASEADARGDRERAGAWREHAARLKNAIDASWDGAWYRRAYFDDGTPLGSAANDECRIDAIAQSWGVISGAADPQRARQAMESVDRLLVRRDARLILLLAPPFERMHPNPGYIRGYLPGVRENGGQYTHAALWTILAFARLGDGDRAGELFRLINPITHALSASDAERYLVEPYVVAADVYSVPPHAGRGGWTWYTGSSGWMYRVGLEGLLGVWLHDGALRIDPCIPRSWPGYEVVVRRGATEFAITVENPQRVSRGVQRIELDGRPIEGSAVPLTDDGGAHRVRVILGGSDRPSSVSVSEESFDRT